MRQICCREGRSNCNPGGSTPATSSGTNGERQGMQKPEWPQAPGEGRSLFNRFGELQRAERGRSPLFQTGRFDGG
jgi:hypothetical protein